MKNKMKMLVVGGVVCMFFLAGLGGANGNASTGDAHHALLKKGIAYYQTIRASHGKDEAQNMLKAWFLKQPSVSKVTMSNGDMTIEFKDGHMVVILGHTEQQATFGKPSGTPGNGPPSGGGGGGGTGVTSTPTSKSALILDPFDWEGGAFSNQNLITTVETDLQNAGYSPITYLKNTDVTLSVIENDLDQYGVIYNRGHGGTSGNHVIISTGEHWYVNGVSAKDRYPTEYNNGEIVEVSIQGLDGNYYYFIAYTSKLIQDHYTNLPNSLVYMESCESMKFSDVGDAYVAAGAGAYMGWDKSVTVTYGDDSTNTIFDMLCNQGISVDDVVNAIGPDPSTHANLEYVGDGGLGL